MGLIDVGYARRAHGITGEVLIRPLTDDPNRWVAGASFVTDESPPRTLETTAVRSHKGDLLVRFESVDDRNAADALRGVRFRIHATDRRDLGEDEYWPDDLVGCTAIGAGGEELGTVVGVEFGEAQDRLVVETGSGQLVEVPLVADIVRAVDLDARQVALAPPDELF